MHQVHRAVQSSPVGQWDLRTSSSEADWLSRYSDTAAIHGTPRCILPKLTAEQCVPLDLNKHDTVLTLCDIPPIDRDGKAA